MRYSAKEKHVMTGILKMAMAVLLIVEVSKQSGNAPITLLPLAHASVRVGGYSIPVRKYASIPHSTSRHTTRSRGLLKH